MNKLINNKIIPYKFHTAFNCPIPPETVGLVFMLAVMDHVGLGRVSYDVGQVRLGRIQL